MSDLRKAAQAALSYWDSESWGDSIMADKMNALRAALAQPEATTERDALRTIMRISDRAKEPCGDDPESPAAIRNGKFSSIAMVAAQGLGMVRGPSLAQPDQPTADGPTREDGRADISLTASDRGLPEPAYAFAGLEGEPDITAYSADQMLAFRAEGKAEGVAQERERWRAAALAGTSGTQPRYAEALRNLVAMLDADVDRLPNVIR